MNVCLLRWALTMVLINDIPVMPADTARSNWKFSMKLTPFGLTGQEAFEKLNISSRSESTQAVVQHGAIN